jgi:hypothetical protein
MPAILGVNPVPEENMWEFFISAIFLTGIRSSHVGFGKALI